MERVTLTITLPHEIGTAIEEKAKLSGSETTKFVEDLLVRAMNRPSLDEVLAPIRRDFAKTGLTEAELDALVNKELKALRAERQQVKG